MIHTIPRNINKCLNNYVLLFLIVTAQKVIQSILLLMVVASNTFVTSRLFYTSHFTGASTINYILHQCQVIKYDAFTTSFTFEVTITFYE